jgi:hypothetical protein
VVALAFAELDVVELTERLEVQVDRTELELDVDDSLVEIGCVLLDVEDAIWLLDSSLQVDD